MRVMKIKYIIPVIMFFVGFGFIYGALWESVSLGLTEKLFFTGGLTVVLAIPLMVMAVDID